MTVRLEADGLDPFTLDDANGVIVQSFDIGFPVVRSVVQPRPNADGEDDTTAFFGGRVVTVVAVVVPTATGSRQSVLDRWASFLLPSRRSYAYFDMDHSGVERRIRLRADQHSRPLTKPTKVDVQVSWRAPDGIQEAADETLVEAPAAVDEELGRTYPLVYPRVYPVSDPVGSFVVVNEGNVDVPPVLRLYGPATNPRIENQTTDQTLEFTANGGVVLAAGEYLEVDVRERTVRLLGDVDQSRYNRLDFTVSAWWRLVPGPNALRYFPVSFSSPATAEIRFRSSWL